MISILDEIRKLRGGGQIDVDRENTNRYTVIARERDGSRTAYCFSAPIYSRASGALVSGRFEREGEAFVSRGSNAQITAYRSGITLKNAEISVTMRLACGDMHQHGGVLSDGGISVSPSLNGVTVSACTHSMTLVLITGRECGFVRQTPKCFALMREGFVPYFTLSPLCSSDSSGIHPATVSYRKTDACTYELTLSGADGGSVLFELNLYEPKLFGDTTVESAHPRENNAFGAMAFLGSTAQLGEQWLYSRPELSKISPLYSAEVKKVLLRVPVLTEAPPTISVYAPTVRFCSFGSTWNNKKPKTPKLTEAVQEHGYMSADVTGIFSDPTERRLVYSEGLILKNESPEIGCAVVATADNYTTPQILEVHFG